MNKLAIEVITDQDDIDTISSQFILTPNNHLFSSNTWYKFNKNTPKLLIIGRQEGQIEFSLMLTVKTVLGFKIAEIAGEPYIQYNNLANFNHKDPSEFLTHLKNILKSQKIGYLHLRNIKPNTDLYPFAKTNGDMIDGLEAPIINLQQFSDFEDYQKSTNSKVRKNRNRKLRKIEADYDIDFQVLIDDEFDLEIIDQIVNLKSKNLIKSGQSSRVFSDKNKINELKAIFNTPKKDFKVVISLLKLDGELASAEIGFIYEDYYCAYLGVIDHKFEKYSPGNIQVFLSIKWAFEQNIKLFDFLPPSHPYKLEWTNKQFDESFSFIISSSFLIAKLSRFYFKKLRPVLKNLYLSIKKK